MLGIEELFELEEALRDELNEHLTEVLTKLNRSNQIEGLLRLLGMESLLQKDSGYQVYNDGKIVVIGQSDVKEDALLAVAKSLGINKSRFEFHLEYEDAKMFNFRKLQWAPTYSLVMVGPIPHSGAVKGDYSSIITAIESEEGYPPIVRLGSSTLKITKSDFKVKLQEMLTSNKLA